jgi:hypothetical protein
MKADHPSNLTGHARRRPVRDDAGAATPLSLMLGVGLIVLPVMVLVLTVPTWEQRSVDAQDAARAAARALAMAANWSSGEVSADEVVNEVLYGDGLPGGAVNVAYSGSLVPGSTVTASVTIVVPAGVVPGLGSIGELHDTASSTEHVDSYEDSPS